MKRQYDNYLIASQGMDAGIHHNSVSLKLFFKQISCDVRGLFAWHVLPCSQSNLRVVKPAGHEGHSSFPLVHRK